jgi:hypothetical protein
MRNKLLEMVLNLVSQLIELVNKFSILQSLYLSNI